MAAVKLQHLLRQGNTVDLAKKWREVLTETLLDVHILSEKNKPTNMWEEFLVFVWIGCRGTDRTFCANTFPLVCLDYVDSVSLLLSLTFLTY